MRDTNLAASLCLIPALLAGCTATASSEPSETGGGNGGGGAGKGGSAGASGSQAAGGGGATSGAGGNAGSAAGGTSSTGVTVSVTPKVSTVLTGATLSLSATVSGNTNMAVSWSVASASCGSVTAGGVYTAPSSVPSPAQCQVTATSQAAPTASDQATLTISQGSTGAAGVWENVTPAGIDLVSGKVNGGDNFGVQDVLVDPVRPSDLYAFTCYQGVWRSTDYGLTWAKSSVDGSSLENGRQWAAAVIPDVNRDPETPPTLFTTNGYGGPQGLFKSTDWGVTWTNPSQPGDIYSIEIDPYDYDHLLVGFHEAPGISESTDGGDTWNPIATPGGTSIYAFFIDTGSAATTRSTWLEIPQAFSGGTTQRTENSGEDWSQVNAPDHPHGSCQIFNEAPGVFYAALSQGVYRSTDYAETWTQVSNLSEAVIVGTDTMLYASVGPNFNPGPPNVTSAPRDPGNTFTLMTVPEGMKHGAKRLAVTNDGSHFIVVAGNWMSGIWRYVEP